MARVSVTRAARDTVSSSRFPLVLALGTLVALVIRVLPTESLWPVLSLPLNVIVLGYAITYSRRIAVDNDRLLPSIRQPLTFARRGVAITLIYILPPVVILGLSWLSALAWSSLPVPEEGILSNIVFGVMDVAAALSSLPLLALVVLMPALYIISGARYAFHDDAREGLHYVEAVKRAWLVRRMALVPIVFTYVWTWALLSTQYIVRRLTHASARDYFRHATASLIAGHASKGDFIAVIGLVLVAALWTAGILIEANLVGQFSGVAYGDPESEAGRSNKGFEPTAAASEVI